MSLSTLTGNWDVSRLTLRSKMSRAAVKSFCRRSGLSVPRALRDTAPAHDSFHRRTRIRKTMFSPVNSRDAA